MNLFQLLRLSLTHRKGARMHFFHGPAVYAFLLDRLGNPAKFPGGCGFLPVESGRVRYEPGERYHLGLILLAGAEMGAQDWIKRLALAPRGPGGLSANAPFGSGVDVAEAFDCVADRGLDRGRRARFLSLEELEPAVRALAQRDVVEIRFDSPLLVLRTPVSKKNRIFDDQVFDADVFLQRVASSCGAAFPALFPASPAPRVRLVRNRLVRTDAPYPRKTLFGSRGSVTLEFPDGMEAVWARVSSAALGEGQGA